MFSRPDIRKAPMFSHLDILYENLLDRLGGREMLELMINASDFNHVYHRNREGLEFTFKAPPSDTLRLAKFAPMVAGSTSSSYYAPLNYKLDAPRTFNIVFYKIVFSVETHNGLGFMIAKPYHNVTLSRPENLVRVFEEVTKLALTFP